MARIWCILSGAIGVMVVSWAAHTESANFVPCPNPHPQEGHGGVVGQLLSAGANVNAAHKDGATPLYISAQVCMPHTILALQSQHVYFFTALYVDIEICVQGKCIQGIIAVFVCD